MVRPQLKSAALMFLLVCACMVPAHSASACATGRRIAQSALTASVRPLVAPTAEFAVALRYTLPPEPKPTTHWPWWLRILAVIGVLVFIRIVAGSVRNKPSGPTPS